MLNLQLLQPSRQQEALPSHIASPAKHGDNVCTLLRAPTPAYRDILHISRSTFQLLLSPNHSSSGDHGWGDIVESDAALAHLLSQVLRHALDASFKNLLVPGEDGIAKTRTHPSTRCSGSH
jgi:hypothetical protein